MKLKDLRGVHLSSNSKGVCIMLYDKLIVQSYDTIADYAFDDLRNEGYDEYEVKAISENGGWLNIYIDKR